MKIERPFWLACEPEVTDYLASFSLVILPSGITKPLNFENTIIMAGVGFVFGEEILASASQAFPFLEILTDIHQIQIPAFWNIRILLCLFLERKQWLVSRKPFLSWNYW